MTWPFGPFTAVSGQIIGGNTTGIRIPQGAVSVEIENDSRMWLYVGFSNIAPKLVTTSLGIDSSGFAIPIRPFGYKCIPLPAGDRGIPFQGAVWIQADDRSSILANTGSFSKTTDVFVTALAKGEAPTLAFTLPRQSDLTSQPRVIAIPPVPFIAPGFGTIPAAVMGGTGSTLLAEFDLHTYFNTTNVISFIAYLYWLELMATPATGVGFCTFIINSQIVQSDHATVVHTNSTFGLVTVYWGSTAAPGTPPPVAFPPTPFPAQVAFPSNLANSYYLQFLASVGTQHAGTAGSSGVNFNILADADPNTGNVPGGIGWANSANSSVVGGKLF